MIIRFFLVLFLTSLTGWSALDRKGAGFSDDILRVATYNLENDLVMGRRVDGRWRPEYPKPEEERNAMLEIIRQVEPDILFVQEIGTENFLEALRLDLKRRGLEFPYSAWTQGEDTVRHIAVLSKLPLLDQRHGQEIDFAYRGERSRLRRGLIEVDVETPVGRITFYNLHFKSKWTEFPDDPQGLSKRTGEATAIRNHILNRYPEPDKALFLVAGDFNDTLDTSPLRRFFIRGQLRITEPVPAADSRGHRWTQHWERQDIYSRIDFILPSIALSQRLIEGRYGIYDGPLTEVASDHRLLWADFDISLD